jgi:hypothetical protein
LTRQIRPIGQQIGGLDINIRSNVGNAIAGTNPVATVGPNQLVQEPNGNTATGNAEPIVQVQINKSLDPRLQFQSVVGVEKNFATDNPELQGEVGIEYDLNKHLSLNGMTGLNDNGQSETKVGVNYRAMLPDIMGPKQGDKDAPNFVRYDVYAIGLGKFQINWETDKVTRGEVKVFDDNNQIVKDVVEKGQHSYEHQVIVDKLSPDDPYEIQITVKDLNGNQAVKTQKVAAQTSS